MADTYKTLISVDTVTSVSDTDYVIVNDSDTVKQITKANLLSELTATVSENSSDISDLDTRVTTLESDTSGGLTNEVKIALANCIANVAWSTTDGQTYYDALLEALDIEYPCTSIALDSSTLSVSEGSASTLTATVTPTNTTDEVIWSSSDESVATVASGTVTGVAEGSCTITATCGDYSASCSVTVVYSGTTYSITNTLTYCSTSNSATTIRENATYTATITVDDGYELTSDDITITLGGTDVTSTVYDSDTGVITVVATGDIVIVATAVEVLEATWTSGTAYDLSGDNVVEGVSLNSSTGAESTNSSYNATAYLNCVDAYAIYCSTNNYTIFYDQNYNFISSSYFNQAYNARLVPSGAAYVRVSAGSTYIASDGSGTLVITPMATPTVAFTSGEQTLTWETYYVDSDGTEVDTSSTSAKMSTSNYIPLYGATSLTLANESSSNLYRYVAFYDVNQNHICTTSAAVNLSSMTNEHFFYFAYMRITRLVQGSTSSETLTLE